MSQNPLADLRDIHLPPDIPFWPLAPGWYVLTGALILIAIGMSIYFIYHWRKFKIKRAALAQLAELEKQTQRSDQALRELAALLKRVAIVFFPTQDVANLHGSAWLSFLDQTGNTSDFCSNEGRLLAIGHYQKCCPSQLEPLYRISRQWIKRLK